MKTLRQIKIEEQQKVVKEWLNSKPKEIVDKYDLDELMFNVEQLVCHCLDKDFFTCAYIKFFDKNEEWIRLLYPEVQTYLLDQVLYICFDEDTRIRLLFYLRHGVTEKLDYVSKAVEIINILSFKSKLG